MMARCTAPGARHWASLGTALLALAAASQSVHAHEYAKTFPIAQRAVVRIESHQQGDRVDLTARIVSESGWWWTLGVSRRLHIEVHMPKDADLPADLDATTGDGRVSLDIPLEGSVTKWAVRGKINGGGAALTIRSGDGSIHIARA